MSLSIRCRNSFLPQDISRGNQYFSDDRALMLATSDARVNFTVYGSSGDYSVELDFSSVDERIVDVTCDCGRYASGFFCKHLWAALRELDSRIDVPGDKTLVLRFAAGSSTVPIATGKEKNHKKTQKGWRKQLNSVKRILNRVESDRPNALAEIAGGRKRMWYVLLHEDRAHSDQVIIRTYESTVKQNGDWSLPQRKAVTQYDVDRLSNTSDSHILRQLKPATSPGRHNRYGSYYHSDGFVIPKSSVGSLLPQIASTGRLAWTISSDQYLREHQPLCWDGRDWQLRLRLAIAEGLSDQIEVIPEVCHQDQVRSLGEVVSVFSDGIVQFMSELGKISAEDARWADALQRDKMPAIPRNELDELLAMLTSLPGLPEIQVDQQLNLQQAVGAPSGKIAINRDDHRSDIFFVEPCFKYEDTDVAVDDERTAFWNADGQTLVYRDPDREAVLLSSLSQFPFEQVISYDTRQAKLAIPVRRFVALTQELVTNGWEVVAHGHAVRQASSFDIQVRTNTDWFDLEADANFDGVSASLPSLLASLKQNSQFVTLDDGSKGILPQAWLEKYARLADVAQENDGTLRFTKSQALLLDALLAEQEGVRVDRDFTKLCNKLKSFDGITPGKEPRGFQGELRDYQRDGVGWFGFLREFGFGGCLADDMGLGKTVQVLAMLQGRRTRRLKKDEQRRPSIVVVPKSLVFNWIDEATKFAPKLRTLNYTGLDRAERLEKVEETDLLITTYGTLRRDIEKLKAFHFDYVILDESQAVKNVKSLSAKAVRLVSADHRLAMTGTPVENHLGELWSLFDFLNPGMLGSGAAFKRVARATDDDTESLSWLSNAIRPFILRRTKQQVLTELPEKTEQTLSCEMTTKQKKKYKELRDYYRAQLSKKVEDVGIKRSKIHVLEALLRLRQAACDPRLLGEKEPAGAKIELLVEQLEGLLCDGHKALVFSQFTSLLSLVRKEFDARGWTYEYLDGKTRKRAEKVERFQTDDDCPLFLISLKAGGSGLNLTAADYVFILDPWWNPAVEAQAVDRAHRIGQTKSVMAYRILCKDTVEDKIIQLQKTKRDLADAIISADKSLISELSLDDLQMLLE